MYFREISELVYRCVATTGATVHEQHALRWWSGGVDVNAVRGTEPSERRPLRWCGWLGWVRFAYEIGCTMLMLAIFDAAQYFGACYLSHTRLILSEIVSDDILPNGITPCDIL